ncbi:MAG: hypothetical protein ABIJ21_09295 [Nanoarchaeota archaeon]
MTSVTLPVSAEFKDNLKEFSWINWSELSREEARKKVIFENYLKTRKLSEDDERFCEEIDWHPVDELPFKKSFIKEMEKGRNQKTIKLEDISKIWK